METQLSFSEETAVDPRNHNSVVEGGKANLPTPGAVKRFALAGNAYFTVVSKKTGNRLTYRVVRKKASNGDDIFFVSALTGPNNATDYRYFGIIRASLSYEYARKARLPSTSTAVRAFAWLWDNVVKPERVEGMRLLAVWHEGRCGACGRRLTVPESIASGIGPECAKKITWRN